VTARSIGIEIEIESSGFGGISPLRLASDVHRPGQGRVASEQ
jgi:hypothetical protein